MWQAWAQSRRRCRRGSTHAGPCARVACARSACVTPAHVRPETRKRRAMSACDMLPPLISTPSCSGNTCRRERRRSYRRPYRAAYHTQQAA
jgi:hypothetical protein